MEIVIDAELESYLPGVPLETEDELERNLLAAGGAIDKLTAWKQEGKDEAILVDGHRRYRLCQKNQLPYDLRLLDFETKDDVKSWMDSYQASRRNMTEAQRAIVIARVYDRVRRRPGPNSDGSSGAREAAAQFGVTERTVYRATNYRDAVAKLPTDVQRKIERGELTPTVREVIELADLPEIHLRRVIREAEDPSDPRKLGEILWGEDGPPVERKAPNKPAQKKKPKPDTESGDEDWTDYYKEAFTLLGRFKDHLLSREMGHGLQKKCVELVDRIDSHLSDGRDVNA